MCKSERTNH
uniref:Uncharacterized protein n=1 Tax=Anguilla anguilla TaxID=7936 RepID=A0A0E9USH0_ANGAN